MKNLIRAVIDTAALRHNLQHVRSVASKSRVMAVVKANAYGHGLVATATALSAADGFAVARIDEALALRAAGLTNRILLLEGVFNAEQLALAAREQFDTMVHSFQQLDLLDGLAGSSKITAWLKVDTGMNRLGFRVEEFQAAYQRLHDNTLVNTDPTLVTHFSSSDDRRGPKTLQQLEAFAAATAEINWSCLSGSVSDTSKLSPAH